MSFTEPEKFFQDCLKGNFEAMTARNAKNPKLKLATNDLKRTSLHYAALSGHLESGKIPFSRVATNLKRR